MSKRLSSGFKEKNRTLRHMLLNFGPIVRVKKDIPKMTMLNVINDIGSSMGLWLGFSTYSTFKMLQYASYAWGNKKVMATYIAIIIILIISIMVIYFSILQHPSYAWATGKTGGFLRSHLSLIFATLVTIGVFALGGVFISMSLDV